MLAPVLHMEDHVAECEDKTNLWANLEVMLNLRWLFNPSLAGGIANVESFSPTIRRGGERGIERGRERGSPSCGLKRRSTTPDDARPRGIKRTCSRQRLSASAEDVTEKPTSAPHKCRHRTQGCSSAPNKVVVEREDLKRASSCFECGCALRKDSQIFMYSDREHCSEECRDMQITKHDLETMSVQKGSGGSEVRLFSNKGRHHGDLDRTPTPKNASPRVRQGSLSRLPPQHNSIEEGKQGS